MSAEASSEPTVVSRFFEGLMGLGEADFQLVRNQYERQWTTSKDEVEDARRAALEVLGSVDFHDVFEAAARRTPDQPQGSSWWAAGDAAVALASRRKISDAHYQLLMRPLAVAMPWLKTAQSE